MSMLVPVSTGKELKKPPWGVIFFVIANLIFFLFTISLGYRHALLIQQVGTLPQRFLLSINYPGTLGKELLYIIVALFLHASWWHLFGNLIFLWVFGVEMESRMGVWQFLGFYIICGILAQFLYIGLQPYAGLPVIGPSGAISGLLGGLLALNPRGNLRIFLFTMFYWRIFLVPVWVFFVIWVIFQVGGLIFVSPVSMLGSEGYSILVHFGGLFTGFLLCILLKRNIAGISGDYANKRKIPCDEETGL